MRKALFFLMPLLFATPAAAALPRPEHPTSAVNCYKLGLDRQNLQQQAIRYLARANPEGTVRLPDITDRQKIRALEELNTPEALFLASFLRNVRNLQYRSCRPPPLYTPRTASP